jgi:aminopeptidase N
MTALSQDEAVTRRALVDVCGYDVHLDLTAAESAGQFTSTTIIDFDCATAGSTTFVELKADELVAAELNGSPVDPARWSDGRLTLDGLASHNRLLVRARFGYSRSGEGLHRFVDPQDGRIYLYSQAALDDAPRMFACFDQPDLKAPFTVSVTAPSHWTVLGNARSVPAEDDPPGEAAAAGRAAADGRPVGSDRSARWAFAPTPPISTYLVAVVAGEYRGVRAEHDGIELGLWCRQSWLPALDPDRLIGTTRAGFDYFHALFDVRYPLDTYHQVFVPELNFLAMENLGLVTLRDEGLLQLGTVTDADRQALANTQLHEMAHMWFGDLVTMRWWNDLWLNESFAEYLAQRALVAATEHTGAWITFLADRKTWGYRADQRSSTHPVANAARDTAEAVLNFDGISYAKGASALRQLATWVGDDAFLTALQEHVRTHAFGNADLNDLIDAMARASGRDVAAWSQTWLGASGVSTLAAEFEVGSGAAVSSATNSCDPARYTRFVLRQRSQVLRPHRLGIGLYDVRGGRLQRREVVQAEVSASAGSDVPALVGAPCADLVLPNDGDLTFALIDLDPRSLQTLREHLGDLADPSTRALVWITLLQLVDQGGLAPSELADLVVRWLGEADPETALTAVLADTTLAADLWVPADRRERLLGRLADWACSSAHQAPAGSDRQVALARAATRCEIGPERPQAWLAGRDLPPGLAVDIDLRWRLVGRLAALGAADQRVLDAEIRRDPSSSGQLHARQAAAAMPSAIGKDSAWRAAVAGDLSNHELTATGQGFWQAGQPELLAPYLDRFVEDLPGLCASQTPGMVKLFVHSFFPRSRVAESTLSMAEGLLATDLTPGARRAVADARDDVQRGLRALSAESRLADPLPVVFASSSKPGP